MNPETFQKMQPLLDKIAEFAEKQLDSEALRFLLAELEKVVGEKKIASISTLVDVFDEGKECSLPLLTTGMSAFPGKEPFRTWGTRRHKGILLRAVSKWFLMFAVRIAGISGISSYRISPAPIAVPQWATSVSSYWILMNVPGAMKEK